MLVKRKKDRYNRTMGEKKPSFKKPKELLELEPKIRKLLHQHGIDRHYSLEEIELMIYNCPPNKDLEVFEPVLKNIQSAEAAEELLIVLHNELWNATPLKMLGGKSPLQVLKEQSPQGRKPYGDWMQISDLLLGIQGEFQKRVYDVIDTFPPAFQEEILSGVHTLFQRFFYTALEDREGAPSPHDIVDEGIRQKNIMLPSDSQLALRVFRSPVENADPHKRMRMVMGFESWETFPLIADYLSESKPTYSRDEMYDFLLVNLGKESLDSQESTLGFLLEKSLGLWWRKNDTVRAIYSQKEWETLWYTILTKSAKDWFDTDLIFEMIFRRMEKNKIDLDFLRENLVGPRGKFQRPGNEYEMLQQIFLFSLGCEYAEFFITPLATYLPILDLHYVEPLDIRSEIEEYKELKQKGESFAEWLAKPPSQIRLRPIGRDVWLRLTEEAKL